MVMDRRSLVARKAYTLHKPFYWLRFGRCCRSDPGLRRVGRRYFGFYLRGALLADRAQRPATHNPDSKLRAGRGITRACDLHHPDYRGEPVVVSHHRRITGMPSSNRGQKSQDRSAEKKVSG